MKKIIIDIISKVLFNIMLGLIVSSSLLAVVLYSSYFFYKKGIVLNQEVIGVLGIYFFFSGFLIPFFSLGKFLFKAGIASVILSLPFYYLTSLFPITYKHLAVLNLSIGFVLFFSYELRHLFKNIFSKINTLKTLKEIDAMGNGDSYEKGRQFEEFVAQLYRNIGYDAKTTTEMRKKGILPESIQKRGGSGEQGVDVFIYDHRTKENVVVQCKHYSSKVSNSAIQEIVASMPLYKASRGIVVTNQYFTEPAKELAFVNKIVLIDREGLAKFISEANKK